MNFFDVIDKVSKLNDDEEIAFHCAKEEFANDFINNCFNSLNISNFRFENSEYFNNNNKYAEYENETCYFITKMKNNIYEITYGSLDFAKSCSGCDIYEYDNNIPINACYKILPNDDIRDKLDTISKQYDDIIIYLKKVLDKLDDLQITL